MRYPKVFIIILNHNGKDVLPDCLNSVLHSDYPTKEVVVVDNDSTDLSFEKAKKLFDKFHFIKNNRNKGFAAGNNVAIRWALEKMADYVFLLNNDAVIGKDSLKKMIESAEKDARGGIFSPIIYKGKTDQIWFGGGKIDWMRMRTVHVISNKRQEKRAIKNSIFSWHISRTTDYVTGCAMLIKKDVFKKIGLLDEDYFLYYEDADFSYRAKKAGFGLKIVSEAKAYHLEKSSENPNKIYWLVYSGLIFFKKNTPWFWRPWVVFYTLLRKIKNKKKMKNKEKYAVDVKRAFEDFKKEKRA
ncbi:MAG: glycosyltransferase family 2 protein [Candidatus Moranbacteria bacterium]|jgi:GT2 family glycosyltransferase|nr:glycosyltransferase family 2 protein [Candidatus Moranbacteria bacterium]MDD5651806.1 glycosyltransferase family 2 protein [Candidatus Moranbacteria bacterium]MDX9856033.1 glycosyltransferase family 2 protein [Candidatus Moranbacteria bacterium]